MSLPFVRNAGRELDDDDGRVSKPEEAAAILLPDDERNQDPGCLVSVAGDGSDSCVRNLLRHLVNWNQICAGTKNGFEREYAGIAL